MNLSQPNNKRLFWLLLFSFLALGLTFLFFRCVSLPDSPIECLARSAPNPPIQTVSEQFSDGYVLLFYTDSLHQMSCAVIQPKKKALCFKTTYSVVQIAGAANLDSLSEHENALIFHNNLYLKQSKVKTITWGLITNESVDAVRFNGIDCSLTEPVLTGQRLFYLICPEVNLGEPLDYQVHDKYNGKWLPAF